MITSEKLKGNGKEFVSHAPGYWPGIAPELWNDWKWQLKNRITSLAQLEQHLELNDQERSGVLLSGDKLALAVTPHFFNLIPRDDPEDPIRRQVIPRIEETWTSPYDMADPCGEDSHMPVPGLVHRYPDRVLFLVTDRCASYCRYCTRSRVVSGVGEQELHTDFEEAFRYLEKHTEIRDVLLSGGDALIFSDDKLDKLLSRLRSIPHIEFLRIGTRVPDFLAAADYSGAVRDARKTSSALDQCSRESSARTHYRSEGSARAFGERRRSVRQSKRFAQRGKRRSGNDEDARAQAFSCAASARITFTSAT